MCFERRSNWVGLLRAALLLAIVAKNLAPIVRRYTVQKMTFVHIICLHLYKATSTIHCDFIAVIETESVFHAERTGVDSVIQSPQFIPSLAGEASDMQHLQCGTNSLSKKFAIARRLLLLRGTFKKNFKNQNRLFGTAAVYAGITF